MAGTQRTQEFGSQRKHYNGNDSTGDNPFFSLGKLHADLTRGRHSYPGLNVQEMTDAPPRSDDNSSNIRSGMCAVASREEDAGSGEQASLDEW